MKINFNFHEHYMILVETSLAKLIYTSSKPFSGDALLAALI